MKRRKFIIGAGALAAGSAAAVGTGAFTQVEAERTVNVSVVGDQAAYLGLVPAGDPDSVPSNNSEYVYQNDAGELEVDIGALGLDSDSGGTEDEDYTTGQGVNPNATTLIEGAFKVINQGTMEVEVDLNSGSGQVRTGNPPTNPSVSDTEIWFYFDADEDASSEPAQKFDGQNVELEVGEGIEVDMKIFSTDKGNDIDDGTLQLVADERDAGPDDPGANNTPN